MFSSLTPTSFLVAGHETTSSSVSSRRTALTALRAELLALDHVVRETMRLHTPMTFTLHVPTENDAIFVGMPYMDYRGVARHKIQAAASSFLCSSWTDPRPSGVTFRSVPIPRPYRTQIHMKNVNAEASWCKIPEMYAHGGWVEALCKQYTKAIRAYVTLPNILSSIWMVFIQGMWIVSYTFALFHDCRCVASVLHVISEYRLRLRQPSSAIIAIVALPVFIVADGIIIIVNVV
ncbi:uncharacterized protein BXZ73DRAFT_111751 [Epithele typhae]|uniref:uncharacterized protein n=1 Tax=Epithele typhae TaxID=378194 RepID=UPI002008A48A|nr:uncharacterized protein BXZ73DRAFT_111751 [Epithele typhae]KAH9897347.1 hypothetical protein BXZ73DRAFT_111751 [Epithele typhae]